MKEKTICRICVDDKEIEIGDWPGIEIEREREREREGEREKEEERKRFWFLG